MVTDLVTIVMAYAVAHFAIDSVFGPAVQAIVPTVGFAIMCVSYGAIALIQGLYPELLSPVFEFRQSWFPFSSRRSISDILCLLVSVGIAPQRWDLPADGALLAAWLPLVRAFARHGWAKWSWWGERVIIIGTGRKHELSLSSTIVHPIEVSSRSVTSKPTMTDGGSHRVSTSTLGSITRLSKIARRYGVRWASWLRRLRRP